MANAADRLTLLERREIEAQIAGPLIQGFIQKFGREATLAVVGSVVEELARQAGAKLAASSPDPTLASFACCLDQWKAGGALELTVLEQTPERLDFNVTRCRFAEMYRALGLADLGGSLSCRRDFALVQGFNPAIRLVRTQTLMEGASHCDFRFRTQPESEPPSSATAAGSADDPPTARVGQPEVSG